MFINQNIFRVSSFTKNRPECALTSFSSTLFLAVSFGTGKRSMHLFGDTRDMETCHYHAWTELTGPIHSRSFACKYPNCKLRHILIQLWFRNRHHFHYQNHHEIVIRKFSIEGVLRCYVSKTVETEFESS